MTPSLSPQARNVLLFSLGHGLSFAGKWAQKTGLGWLAWESTHSVAWVGTLALADLVAAIWVAPLAGMAADRSAPCRLLFRSEGAACLLALLFCAASLDGQPDIRGLLLFAVADATLRGLGQPVLMLAPGLLAPPNGLPRAVACSAIAISGACSLGPMMAGILMHNGPVALVFGFSALSSLPLFLILRHLRPWLERPAPTAPHAPLVADMREGLRHVFQERNLRQATVLVLSFSFLARPFTELLPAFVGEVFRGGPEGLSLLMGTQGLGALLGALSMSCWLPAGKTLWHTAIGAGCGLVASLLWLCASTDLAAAMPALMAAGTCHVIGNVAMQSLYQLRCAPSFKGRAMAWYGLIFRVGPAVGAFAIAQAARWNPLPFLVGAGAVTYLLILLIVANQGDKAGEKD